MYNIIENLFKLNNYNGIESKKDFIIIKGTNNVMLSCPHTVNQIRDNNLKYSDMFTGTIGFLSYLNCNSSLILKVKSSGDSNYENDDYRKELKQYILKNNIKYLIDIHGCKNIGYDVILGTSNRTTIKSETLILVENLMKANNIKYAIDYIFSAGERTLTNNIHKEIGIETIQIEISNDLRLKNTDKAINLIIALSNLLETI